MLDRMAAATLRFDLKKAFTRKDFADIEHRADTKQTAHCGTLPGTREFQWIP